MDEDKQTPKNGSKETQHRYASSNVDLEAQNVYNSSNMTPQMTYDPLQQQPLMMPGNTYGDPQNYYPTLERNAVNQVMMTPRRTGYMQPTGNGAEYMYGPAIYPQMNQPLLATSPQPITYQNIQQPFDNCPAICSLFAIFCCPITCLCSLPALVYSLCAYTDYRADDLHQYRKKSDKSRRLVISACLVGLLLCVSWAILTFFYYDEMVRFLSDFIEIIRKRTRRSLNLDQR